MLSKKDKQKLLNKFKFIETMNGYSGTNWWRDNDKTCQRCQLNFLLDEDSKISKCFKLRKRLCYSFKSNDIFEDEWIRDGFQCATCVEFLRRPMNQDNLGS